jgi:putative ABC transport system substrate-binding protein
MDAVVERRQCLALLGGALVWPLAARAQQAAIPRIGFLNHASTRELSSQLAGFHRGLNETGYVEGRNIAIEYRWAEGQFDRLPALASELVSRDVALIFAGSPPAVRAARIASATLPIVFSMGEDPVSEGLVESLNRPGHNVTGYSHFANQLFAKRLGLLSEVATKAAAFAFLVNPNNPNADSDTKDVQRAARGRGRGLEVFRVNTDGDLEAAFDSMSQKRIGALIVGVDGSFLLARREQIAAMAARHMIPAVYDRREFPEAGGLMSYGTDRVDAYRQGGIYVGRVLKGEKPADLPVQQATKFEFVINLRTAKVLGLHIPPGVLAIADAVIE